MLAKRIERVRRERRLSLAQFASECGVTRQSAYAWANGKSYPAKRHLPRVAEVLGTTAKTLWREFGPEAE